MKGKVILMAGITFAMLGAFLACTVSEGEGRSDKDSSERVIVALGDSLTAGYGVKEKEAYPARLERKLRDAGYKARVINAGISGEISYETLMRINRVLALGPSIVVLEIGVNDGFQGVDPQLIRRNIEELVRVMQQNGITVVLAGMRMFDNVRKDYNTTFAAIYPEVAKKFNIILIPHFLEGVAGDPALNRLDGIHPTAKGYRIVVDNVYHYLLKVKSLR